MTQENIVHKNSKVLVTGVTGYVGAHVAQQLLLHGYQVRGTVRSTSDEEKLNKIRDQITEGLQTTHTNLPELEFFEADLLKEDVWPQAVAGCQYVCHVASPFPLIIPTDPDTLIKPAVDGTLFVLRAASNDGNVKRLVLTSSLAAVHDVKTLDAKSDPDKVYNEDDWVDEDKVEAYSKSKILAEKAAHKFIEDLPQEDGKKKLELVVINPSYVLGPMLTDSLSTSVLGIKRLLDKSTPAVPKFNMAICDVRDVALAHVKALESPEHVGKRFLIVSECKWMKDIAKMIQKELKPFGYFVPTMTVPSTLVWLSSFVDKSTQMVAARLDREFKLDNKRMVEELKITPTETEKTVIDTCISLIEKGIIRPTRKYKKAKHPEPAEEAAAATEATSEETANQSQAGGDVPSPQPIKAES